MPEQNQLFPPTRHPHQAHRNLSPLTPQTAEEITPKKSQLNLFQSLRRLILYALQELNYLTTSSPQSHRRDRQSLDPSTKLTTPNPTPPYHSSLPRRVPPHPDHPGHDPLRASRYNIQPNQRSDLPQKSPKAPKPSTETQEKVQRRRRKKDKRNRVSTAEDRKEFGRTDFQKARDRNGGVCPG